MNISAKVFVLFTLLITSVMMVDSVFAQRNSSNTTKKKPPVTTPQEPQVSKVVVKSDISYDFDRLRSSDTFRGIPWGASKQQILEVDNNERKENGDDYLVLSGQLSDINVDISFFFWRGHFIKGTYFTTDSWKDFAGYLEKYEYLKRVLIKKYGQPKIDLRNWTDVQFKNTPDRWLQALGKGHVEYFAIWQKDNVVIQIELGSKNANPGIKIEYYIDNFDTEMQQVDDTDILKDL